MKSRIDWLSVFAVIGVIALVVEFALPVREANASDVPAAAQQAVVKQAVERAAETTLAKAPLPLGVITEASRAIPVLTDDKAVKSLGFTQATCATSATAITVPTGLGRYRSIECWNVSSTPIYLGDSTVTTTIGRPVCNDAASCPSSSWSADILSTVGLYCRVGSGTATLYCQAGD